MKHKHIMYLLKALKTTHLSLDTIDETRPYTRYTITGVDPQHNTVTDIFYVQDEEEQ